MKKINDFISKIQNIIDSTTMYKTVISSLLFLILISSIYAAFGETDFSITAVLITLVTLVISNITFNYLISKFLDIKPHQESTFITALILYLIYTPTTNIKELILIITVSFISVISKYLITKNDTHLLNPAAFGALIGGIILNYPATWWIGSAYMFPYIVITTLVILRKQRKFLISSLFLITSLICMQFVYSKFYESTIELIVQSILKWPLLYFISVMVTEPFTLPSRKNLEYLYVILIAILTVIPYNFGKLGTSPETALIIANIIFFIAEPRSKYKLTLKKKEQLTEDIYEFTFDPNKKVNFEAGQYMEIMLPHKDKDIRGERRYFTISSSPIEKEIKFTIRINNKTNGSSYKKHLVDLELGDVVYGQQVKGDFVLKDKINKYVFVAGGIGVTPFLSILTNIIKTKTKKDIKILYISNRENDFIHKNIFSEANKLLGIDTYYLKKEDVNKTFINKNITDIKNRYIYISGPNMMVNHYKELFVQNGASNKNIVTDFFNGF